MGGLIPERAGVILRPVRWAPLILIVAGCGPRPAPERRTVEGALATPADGDGYVFLYEPGEGPPANPGVPRYATGVSDARLQQGDGRFVFADVAPGQYRLWGFVDADRNVRLAPDVLAQPGAGDRALVAREVEVIDRLVLPDAIELGAQYAHEPPSFQVAGAVDELVLTDLPLAPVSLQLIQDDVEVYDPTRGGFVISPVDADGDGTADDANGDGLPDLSPQLFLRFRPRPGQPVPLNNDGTQADVVVPFAFNPAAFLVTLGQDPAAELVVSELTVFMIPQAQAVFRAEGGRRLTVALDAIPVGDYELVVLSETGQLWRIPNGLEAAGQNVRFTIAHGS